FDLYPQNNYDYSQSNKSKNNRNTSNDQVEIPKGKVSQTEFEEALRKCSETANSAYNRSSIYAHKIESAIKKLNSYIIAINYEILSRDSMFPAYQCRAVSKASVELLIM
ncbi:MAG: hypothetical protein ACKPFK_04960, partial [Dolichospermum sp.]